MPIIATAGHVDHGKSTLVLALTGIDPDRLEEEKRRGLTIDLGFAYFTTPGGRLVGIVDVPGHEKFVKNMLAGVGSIDLNLFVVDANEGWKAQSQEHLDILDLLGVRRAIVVVSKADTAGAERLEEVKREVAERLRGSSLEGAKILAVSAVTGTGLGELLAEIDALLAKAEAEAPGEPRRLRMWIDRAFTIKGSGTVVTGTLAGGTLRAGQEVEILPAGRRARIRTIQSHNREVGFVEPGTRTALNLAGVERTTVRRGDTLALPGEWRPTTKLLAQLRFLDIDFEPRAGSGYKFHVGSIEIDAVVRFPGGRPGPGGSATAVIQLAHPATVEFSERFILRDAGRHDTVGGGVVLEAYAEPLGRSTKALLAAAEARRAAGTRLDYLQVLLAERGFLAADEVLVATGLDPGRLELPGAREVDGFWLSEGWLVRTAAAVEDRLRSYQAAHPVDAGMPLLDLRKQWQLPDEVVDRLLGELARQGRVVADSTAVRTADFTPQTVGPAQQRLLDEVRAAGASPPSIAELNQAHGPALVRAMIRSGDLVQVTPFAFSAEFIAGLKSRVAERVREVGPFTVADFRDMVGTTRKYAVPLVEYLDQVGFTTRRGDLRMLGPRAPAEPGSN